MEMPGAPTAELVWYLPPVLLRQTHRAQQLRHAPIRLRRLRHDAVTRRWLSHDVLTFSAGWAGVGS